MEGLSCLCVVKTLTMLCLMKFAITFLLNTQYIIIKTLSQNQSGAERVVLSRESVCVCMYVCVATVIQNTFIYMHNRKRVNNNYT